MYATKAMSKEEIALVKKMSPFAGFLGHHITGYKADGSLLIETDSEVQAAKTQGVEFIRKKNLNGKYTYRRIIERP